MRTLILAFPTACHRPSSASAVVIRHEVTDPKYSVPTSEFPALAEAE